ncbi:MAG TPA: hypothetical protein VMS65_09710 [Polyangiaceae bacterium]|nr:hypothetical protein [Polyangiaceae bacterium]
MAGRVLRNDVAFFGGDPGVSYCVKAKVDGVVSARNYADDTIMDRPGAPYGVSGTINFGTTSDASWTGTDGWRAGGIPAAGNDYTVYALLVGSPRKIFYLNSISLQNFSRITQATYQVHYEAIFNVKGGSRLQFMAADYNSSAVRNCMEPVIDVTCQPHVANPAPPPSPRQPFEGQFLVMTLLDARVGACICTTPSACNLPNLPP